MFFLRVCGSLLCRKVVHYEWYCLMSPKGKSQGGEGGGIFVAGIKRKQNYNDFRACKCY